MLINNFKSDFGILAQINILRLNICEIEYKISLVVSVSKKRKVFPTNSPIFFLPETLRCNKKIITKQY